MKTLSVKVKPNAKTSELAEQEDGTWKASLKSPPVDGKANQELIKLISKSFRCPKSDVAIKSGAGSRLKRITIASE
ncbi:DUF167 family protein [Puniceicoccus vermicola]|uniref:UPF0235 protein H5P30_01825 n=1 Tax=Puniceicoccus vermicola TaxID=388746 RepID=A0A7X1E328_9BACT|nr:DUF167 domain-containing protein [Puniceicoccus vermicola]